MHPLVEMFVLLVCPVYGPNNAGSQRRYDKQLGSSVPERLYRFDADPEKCLSAAVDRHCAIFWKTPVWLKVGKG